MKKETKHMIKTKDKRDLTDLYPAPKVVPFGTGTIEVTGISMRKVAVLIDEYPELVPLFSGETVPLDTLLTKAPDAALAIFSQAVPDEEVIRAFDVLPFGQQIDILGAIFDLTLGGERAVPFVDQVAAQLRSDREAKSKASPKASPNSTSSSQPAATAATPAT
jgi:hypothetical protein